MTVATLLDRSSGPREAPVTLRQPPPKLLGWWDQSTLWVNLGISLTLPVAAAFVLQPVTGLPALSLSAAVVAVVVGSVLGSAVLGLSAVPGADTGAPAMVLLRGLFGRRGSYVPTLLNILQCVGWAAVEVFVIADTCARLTDRGLRPLFVVLAGIVATVLALYPLSFVRVLRRYAVWAVVAASAYLFVGVLRHGVPGVPHGSWRAFWLAVDVVVALPVSWAPLAADYSRHSRSGAAAFGGAFAGYTAAAVAYFLLGTFAILALPGASRDVIGSLIAVPVGGLALGVLALDELDKAFANIYSTAVSTQNLGPWLDRRVLALPVGALAVVLGLFTTVTRYEDFLYLIGSVFVPLFAVVIVDYFGLRRGRWDVGADACPRWLMLLPWLAGFVAYQLVNPGGVAWWVHRWTAVDRALHFTPPSWMSASITSFVVAAVLTLPAGAAGRRWRG